MEVGPVVETSLSALASAQIIVVPGEGNLSMAKKGLKMQLDAL
jgi:hypothetical protein